VDVGNAPAANMNFFFEHEAPFDHDNLYLLQNRQDRDVALVANGRSRVDHSTDCDVLDLNDFTRQGNFNDILTNVRDR
jgi:hypothetical protein